MFSNAKNATTIHLLLLSSFIFISGMEDNMPVQLYRKLNIEKLHPKCAFLVSVSENDCDSVKWMLQNHAIPQGKNKLDYFSIIPSETSQENVIPMAVAFDKQVFEVSQILLPLAPISHTVQPSFERRPGLLDKLYINTVMCRDEEAESILNSLESDPGIIDGPQGPAPFYKPKPLYPLYLAACSKNLGAYTEKISSLKPSDNDSSFIQCLLLIVILNSDTQGLKLIKNLVFNKNKNELHNWLGMTFTLAVGLGNNKASFSTEDEIKELMNYPLLRDKKPTLLKALNTIALAAHYHNCDMFNNPQIKKATQILCDAIESDFSNIVFSEQQTQELF